MELKQLLMWLVMFLFGMIVDACIEYASKDKPVGTLRVDHSDPDEAYLFLELENGIGDISNKKYVLLKVDTQSYIPRK